MKLLLYRYECFRGCSLSSTSHFIIFPATHSSSVRRHYCYPFTATLCRISCHAMSCFMNITVRSEWEYISRMQIFMSVIIYDLLFPALNLKVQDVQLVSCIVTSRLHDEAIDRLEMRESTLSSLRAKGKRKWNLDHISRWFVHHLLVSTSIVSSLAWFPFSWE